MTDHEFGKLIGESCIISLANNPTNVLIAGLTDSFHANARASRLALQCGTPYIQAGIYQDGSAAEISFSYPGITPSCARCTTSSRYKEYANGFKNDATSDGCPIFTTDILNGVKGFISLMLLLYKTPTRFGKYLDGYANKNFLQINFDPFSQLFPGAPIGNVQYFEQKPDHPSNGYEQCPDCQGMGQLHNVKGTISDTRKIFDQGE